MAKYMQILFVAFLAIALCAAEAPRGRSSRLHVKRSRFLARQEVEAEPAVVTPYPSADELKPEVPFDESPVADDQAPHQPDEVYGPPEQEATVETEDVVPVEAETAAEAEEAAIAAEEAAIAEEEAAAAVASSRLTNRRGGARKNAVRPAKLRKSAPGKLRKVAPAKLRKVAAARQVRHARQ